MAKANLKLVPKPALALPYDPEKGRRRMIELRAQLLAVAVRYVKEGKDGSRPDRLRTASNLSGVPLNLIDVEAAR